MLDDDNFFIELTKRTSCTSGSIQDLGVKLLGTDVAVSHCNDAELTMKIYKIYKAWRRQMREQRKAPNERVELLRRALTGTLNAAALNFLDSSLDPPSVPPKRTCKSINSSACFCSSNFVLF